MLQILLNITERLLFGYNVKLPSEERIQKIHEIASKKGTWKDFLK